MRFIIGWSSRSTLIAEVIGLIESLTINHIRAKIGYSSSSSSK